MTKILFAAAEAAPFYKTGGLGDVAYALPKALQRAGNDIRVVVPYYPTKMPAAYTEQLTDVTNFTVAVGWRQQYCGIKTLLLGKVRYYFIDNLYYFGRDGLYGYADDGERFAFFQLALCEMMARFDFIPDVLHVNDWHTAFVPVLLRDKYQWINDYRAIKTVLTIHNLRFQGVFDPVVLSDLFGIGMATWQENGTKYFDQVNFLKGGINYADAINTVSPSYAQEIQTPAFGEGLDGTLRQNAYKLHGILNGIDNELYDPATDTNLAANYTATDRTGKAADKQALQASLGLPQRKEVPLFAMISRLTSQKGAQLLVATLDDFLVRHDAQVVVLGTGDPDFEQQLRDFQVRYPGQCAVRITFNEALAQQIYAGSDYFLMPSAFEPSGLSQMMAMRYGSIPVVHLVGGLRDSVQPYNQYTGAGTGFGFDNYSSVVLGEIMSYAYRIYHEDAPAWQQLQQQAMVQDFDWRHSAQDYQRLYQQVIG